MSDPGGLEHALARLEEIVTRLDREDLELEEALRLFEEGVGHVRAARQALQDAQLRVERLVEDAAGPVLEPMPRPADE